MELQQRKKKTVALSKCLIALIGIFLYGLIRSFMIGRHDSIAINLIFGALISVVLLLGYLVVLAKDKKSWFSSIIVFSNFFVLIFDMYIIFYVGLFYLIQQFSFQRLGQSVLLIAIGWLLIKNLQSFTEKS